MMSVSHEKNNLYFLTVHSLKRHLNRSKLVMFLKKFIVIKKLSNPFRSGILYFQMFWII